MLVFGLVILSKESICLDRYTNRVGEGVLGTGMYDGVRHTVAKTD